MGEFNEGDRGSPGGNDRSITFCEGGPHRPHVTFPVNRRYHYVYREHRVLKPLFVKHIKKPINTPSNLDQ